MVACGANLATVDNSAKANVDGLGLDWVGACRADIVGWRLGATRDRRFERRFRCEVVDPRVLVHHAADALVSGRTCNRVNVGRALNQTCFPECVGSGSRDGLGGTDQFSGRILRGAITDGPRQLGTGSADRGAYLGAASLRRRKHSESR